MSLMLLILLKLIIPVILLNIINSTTALPGTSYEIASTPLPCVSEIYKPLNRIDSMLLLFSSHSFGTSSSLDVPAGVTQEEGHTGFFIHLLSAVRALIFLARRIQPFLSLVDREVEFCVLTI